METMAVWKIITLACAFSILVDAKWLKQKRAAPSNICDPAHNNTNLVQCYCTMDRDSQTVRNAECCLTDAMVQPEHNAWKSFSTLKDAHKIIFTNTRGIPLTYVPTNSLKETRAVTKFEIKYGVIETVGPYAFANVSSIEELTLTDNKITSLSPYAFANHMKLKILSLDTNSLIEINRDVFVNLPALEKLYLTNNEISTIHDRAFIQLGHLIELEIDRNKVFSLNSATFEGLRNLEKLDLSNNALEVIGDNTFEVVENLKHLNLDENKIQMLDESAFHGLGKLLSLSLARNNLVTIENDKVFDGLHSLQALSLRGNQIKVFKSSAIAPVLSNFYGVSSSLDVEDNNFPCDCKLDWFISLMNKTLNKHLKITMENFKCIPDAKLQDAWTKFSEAAEAEKNQNFEEEEAPANDFEYYEIDDKQLNGKLFYLDVRELLLCDNNTAAKEISPTQRTMYKSVNQGLLDLSITTPAVRPVEIKASTNIRDNNEKDLTTTRFATFSASPVESKIYEDMASDEGIPDKIKSHRSVQDNFEQKKSNSALHNYVNLILLVLLLGLDALISYC